MKKSKIMFVMCLFLVNIFSVYGLGQLGEGDFTTGQTYFNENMDDPTIYTQTLANPQSIMVIDDIDGDSIDDMVIIDNNVIEVYNNASFNLLTSVATGCTGYYSNVVLFDIDDDGYKEVIFECQGNNDLKIFEYNGTSWTTQLNHDTLGNNHVDGESLIACAGVNDCVMVYFYGAEEHNSNKFIFMLPFNSTTAGSEANIASYPTSGDWLRCFAPIPYIEVADVDDNGGEKEYIFTVMRGQAAANNEDVELYIIDTDDDLTINELHEVSLAIAVDNVAVSDTCATDNFGRFLTSPLAVDIDDGTSGLEIVIGYMPSDNDFRLKIYDKDLNLLDTEPNVFQAEGNILSNPVLMNALPDTNREEVCVLGYKALDGTVSLMCGSIESATDEIEYDSLLSSFSSGTSAPPYTTYKNSDMLMFQVDANSDFTDGSNLDEVSTHFGTLKLIKQALDSDLEQLYPFTTRNGTIIPNKFSGYPTYDLIVVSGTKMYYFDDNAVNQPAYLTGDSNINPSPLSVWKQNTTVQIDLYVTDPESDTVCARTIIYYNDAVHNETNNTGVCGVSGTNFKFLHTAEYLTSLSTLAVIINDSGTNEDRFILFNFSVGAFGAEFGDSTFFITDPLLEDDSTILSTDETSSPVQGNAMQESVEGYAVRTGLGTTIIWLIVMFVVAIVLFVLKPREAQMQEVMAVIGISEILLLIIGVMQGFISTGILWVLVILSVLVTGFFLGRKYLSGNGGE